MTENDFSQSELTTLDVCGRKWFWQYGQKLKKRGMFNWFFEVGGALHNFLEDHYKNGFRRNCKLQTFSPVIGPDVMITPKFNAEKLLWEKCFTAYCEMYIKFWGSEPFEIVGTEQVVSRTFDGINFRGKIDLKIRNRNCIGMMDHKTTHPLFVVENEADLHTRFQFLFYFWLAGIEEGEFTINQIVKPNKRIGKKESELDFAVRCRDDIYDKPEEYFKRVVTYYTNEEMKRFEEKVLLPKVEKLKRILGGKIEDAFIWSDMAMGSCTHYNTPCPFMSLCFENEALATIDFEPKSSKHEELEVEE